jgi:large subunit ribosomal protein L22
MTKYKYAFKTEDENVVKTVGRDVSMSPKMAIEMCKHLKGMPVAKAKGILELVKEQKLAIPVTRATNGVGHKKSTSGAGKYPLKGSIEFLKLLKQLEINAQNKNLGADLILIHACSQRASEPFHFGRKRRVQNKRCHIELAAMESKSHSKKTAAPKKAAKKVNAQ